MIIHVLVKPNAKMQKVEKLGPNEFKVYLKSPPIDRKANKELIDLISKYFNTPKSNIEIIKGKTSGNKVLKIN